MNVVVVGAGIVGLSAARFIAEKGIEVDVYDSKRFVDEGAAKASGILSANGLGSLKLDYSASIVNSLKGARLHAAGSTISVKSSKVEAHVVDRGLLAKAAERSAREAGASIHLRERLDRPRILQMASERNAVLVGADGAVSNVASAFGFPGIDDYVLTYKAEADVTGPIDRGSVDIFFSNRIAKGLFGWAVPYSGSRVEIGIGVSSAQKITGKRAFEMLVSSGVLGNMHIKKVHDGYASMIPLKRRAITVKGNVALVGDAAGQVKATTGGGIVFGVGCAKILADAVAEAAHNGGSLSSYERAWRKAYGADLRMHRMIHGYYTRAGDRYLGATFSLMRGLGFERFFSRHGDMDSPMRMVKSLLTFGLVG